MKTEPDLECYLGEGTHVAAYSPEDAAALSARDVGTDLDAVFVLLDPEESFTVHMDGEGDVTLKAREWVTRTGHGVISSIEWG